MIWRQPPAKGSGASGYSVPIAGNAAVADARFPFVWPRFCRVTPLPPRCSGSCWSGCWRDFRSRRRRKNCGCPSRWKPCTGCDAICAGSWTSFAPGCAAAKGHRAVRRQTPYCKPSNIFRRFSQARSVRRRPFSSIFSIHFWNNPPLGAVDFSKLSPPRFSVALVHAGDNTIIQSLPVPADL